MCHGPAHLVGSGDLHQGRIKSCPREFTAFDARHALAQSIARPVDSLAQGLVSEELLEDGGPG